MIVNLGKIELFDIVSICILVEPLKLNGENVLGQGSIGLASFKLHSILCRSVVRHPWRYSQHKH